MENYNDSINIIDDNKETFTDSEYKLLMALNSETDLLDGVYEGIQSLAHYQTEFYGHISSLNVTNEHDMYTVSGWNCSATPISISWGISGSGESGGTGV